MQAERGGCRPRVSGTTVLRSGLVLTLAAVGYGLVKCSPSEEFLSDRSTRRNGVVLGIDFRPHSTVGDKTPVGIDGCYKVDTGSLLAGKRTECGPKAKWIRSRRSITR